MAIGSEPNTKRTLGLDLLEPNTKTNGHGPLGAQHKEDLRLFREESAHKAEQSTAPLDLDPWAHMPCILKSTLHEPPLGPCLDIEKNRYENPPSSSPPFIFGQTPLLEEFVCLWGPGLPETVELSLPLTILPFGMGFSLGFSEETETSLSREESTIKVLDNSMKPSEFSEDAFQESGM